MITLREAIDQGKLQQFIREHPEIEGDMDAFNRTVEAMARKSSEDRPASSQDGSDD